LTTLNYCYIALTVHLVNLFLLTDMLPQHKINIMNIFIVIPCNRAGYRGY